MSRPMRPDAPRVLARLRGDRDRGAATLEHVGVVVVAALLVAAVVLAVTMSSVGPRVAAAICEIVTLGQGSCAMSEAAPERSAEDYLPPEPCVITGDGQALRGSVAVGVQIDAGGSWFIEELGDGRFRLTRTAEGGVGAEIGMGFDVSATWDDNRYGLAATAGAAATLSGRTGDVYYASSAEEAAAILAAATSDDVKDSLVGDGWFGRDFVDWITGASDHEQLDPDSVFEQAGVDAMGQAALTLLTLDASAEGYAGVFLGRSRHADGSTTDLFTAGAEGSARASGLLGENGVTDDVSAVASLGGALTVEIDRDEQGNPTAMRLVTMRSAHADVDAWENEAVPPTYSESIWQVPLDSESHRYTAAKVLVGLGIEAAGVTTSVNLTDFSWLDYGGSWGDLMDLAKTEGYAWTQDYTLDQSSYGAGLDAKWILEAGLSGEYTTTSRTATGYTYWNGQEFVSRPGCLAQG